MIIIDVTKEKSIESALKKYKRKVRDIKQNEQLRKREEFVKPSVKKRPSKRRLSIVKDFEITKIN